MWNLIALLTSIIFWQTACI